MRENYASQLPTDEIRRWKELERILQMKSAFVMKQYITPLFFCLLALSALAQGTLVYDQQSSTNETGVAAGALIQQVTPLGQSFTPTLSAVGFIRLALYDENPDNGVGVTLNLNLREGASTSGTILATSAPLALGNGFSGRTNFLFNGAIPVTPGNVYLFELVIQTGDLWRVTSGEYNYPGGTAFANGFPAGGMTDLWFREGIVVPEPSVLTLLGVASLLLSSHFRQRNSCSRGNLREQGAK